MTKCKDVLVSHKLMQLMGQLKTSYSIADCIKDIQGYIDQFEELSRLKIPETTILKIVYKLIDSMCQELVNEGGISCRKGCGHCCHMNVDISPVEAQYILDFTKENNIPIDVPYLQGQSQIDATTQGLHPVYSKCTFLQKDNTCGIYGARPLACRKYLVTSPAARCEITRYPDGQQDVMCDSRMEVLESALYSVYREFGSMSKMLLQKMKTQSKNEGSVFSPEGQSDSPGDYEQRTDHFNTV